MLPTARPGQKTSNWIPVLLLTPRVVISKPLKRRSLISEANVLASISHQLTGRLAGAKDVADTAALAEPRWVLGRCDGEGWKLAPTVLTHPLHRPPAQVMHNPAPGQGWMRVQAPNCTHLWGSGREGVRPQDPHGCSRYSALFLFPHSTSIHYIWPEYISGARLHERNSIEGLEENQAAGDQSL